MSFSSCRPQSSTHYSREKKVSRACFIIKHRSKRRRQHTSRHCLQLIVDCPSAIQEELDLIRALGYLEEFGVKILPLQVRLCSDRLSLIKDCLAQMSTNYKQSAKLLGLANLLRVAGYSKSWEVCSQLGQSDGYRDLGARQELMAFALTHCPPSAIEALLGVSSSLQTQMLYQAVNYLFLPSDRSENANSSGVINKDTEDVDPVKLRIRDPSDDDHSGENTAWGGKDSATFVFSYHSLSV
ncbi:NBAS subunit of NRZ tethering complex-like [Melanerpes formicivorus]|uniref:NBAS subunit of NRZ tethering complex-like n=1 Tax=Melanerpes formicivorus TaxID=211600 RepID=UPI00358E0723